MDWYEVIQIVATGIASLGGSVVIIGAFSSYFGKIWAEKYLDSIKKENQKELEGYKSQLDMLKESSLRYSGQQFQLYNELWHSLYDLKLEADLLWNDASQTNLKQFSKQLKSTVDKVERSFLFIEDNHYPPLKKLLNQFSEYKLGKTDLIQIYSMRNVSSISTDDIDYLIRINGNLKREYEQLIENIRADLKKQIRGV